MEPLVWKDSSFCESNGCVHVAQDSGAVFVKSHHGDQVLVFSAAEWQAFISGVKAGEFDLGA